MVRTDKGVIYETTLDFLINAVPHDSPPRLSLDSIPDYYSLRDENQAEAYTLRRKFHTVSGRVNDPNATVTVNGMPVKVEGTRFSVTLHFNAREEFVFRATNAYGSHAQPVFLEYRSDIDGDRMDDEWEDANGLNSQYNGDANTDLDGDGVSNFMEFTFGTDPQEPLDHPPIIDFEGGQFEPGQWISGQTAWSVQSEHVLNGEFSAKSPSLAIGETAELRTQVISPGGYVVFDVETVGMGPNDHFEVRLNGKGFQQHYGNQHRQNVSLWLEAGAHILSFVASRHPSGTEGSGFVIIDDLILPASTEDLDRDGVIDGWEKQYFGTIYEVGAEGSENSDHDGDGLTDLQEYALGLDPTKSDTDSDEMPDGWEIEYGVDALVESRIRDSDGDKVSDLNEFLTGTDPLDPADHVLVYDFESGEILGNGVLSEKMNPSSSKLMLDASPVLNYRWLFGDIHDTSATDGQYVPPSRLNFAAEYVINAVPGYLELTLSTLGFEGRSEEFLIYVNGVQKYALKGTPITEPRRIFTRLDGGITRIRFEFAGGATAEQGVLIDDLVLPIADEDQDSDGIPDSWELTYFGSDSPDPEADSDGDGLTNRFEYSRGSHPLLDDSTNRFRRPSDNLHERRDLLNYLWGIDHTVPAAMPDGVLTYHYFGGDSQSSTVSVLSYRDGNVVSINGDQAELGLGDTIQAALGGSELVGTLQGLHPFSVSSGGPERLVAGIYQSGMSYMLPRLPANQAYYGFAPQRPAKLWLGEAADQASVPRGELVRLELDSASPFSRVSSDEPIFIIRGDLSEIGSQPGLIPPMSLQGFGRYNGALNVAVLEADTLVQVFTEDTSVPLFEMQLGTGIATVPLELAEGAALRIKADKPIVAFTQTQIGGKTEYLATDIAEGNFTRLPEKSRRIFVLCKTDTIFTASEGEVNSETCPAGGVLEILPDADGRFVAGTLVRVRGGAISVLYENERGELVQPFMMSYLGNYVPYIYPVQPKDAAVISTNDIPLFVAGITGGLADNLQWWSDRDGFLGTGVAVQPQSLSLGDHVITLYADNDAGNPMAEEVSISVRDDHPTTVYDCADEFNLIGNCRASTALRRAVWLNGAAGTSQFINGFITVTINETGQNVWDIQQNFPVAVEGGKSYRAGIMIRASTAGVVEVNVAQANEPWGVVSRTVRCSVSSLWTFCGVPQFTVAATEDLRLTVQTGGTLVSAGTVLEMTNPYFGEAVAGYDFNQERIAEAPIRDGYMTPGVIDFSSGQGTAHAYPVGAVSSWDGALKLTVPELDPNLPIGGGTQHFKLIYPIKTVYPGSAYAVCFDITAPDSTLVVAQIGNDNEVELAIDGLVSGSVLNGYSASTWTKGNGAQRVELIGTPNQLVKNAHVIITIEQNEGEQVEIDNFSVIAGASCHSG